MSGEPLSLPPGCVRPKATCLAASPASARPVPGSCSETTADRGCSPGYAGRLLTGFRCRFGRGNGGSRHSATCRSSERRCRRASARPVTFIPARTRSSSCSTATSVSTSTVSAAPPARERPSTCPEESAFLPDPEPVARMLGVMVPGAFEQLFRRLSVPAGERALPEPGTVPFDLSALMAEQSRLGTEVSARRWVSSRPEGARRTAHPGGRSSSRWRRRRASGPLGSGAGCRRGPGTARRSPTGTRARPSGTRRRAISAPRPSCGSRR